MSRLELVIHGVTVVITGDARVELLLPKKKKQVEDLAPAKIEEVPQQVAPPAPRWPKVIEVVGERLPPVPAATKKRMGALIRDARATLGLGQAQLNKLCGFPQSMISLYETGRRYPNEARRRALEVALQLPEGHLG